MENIKLLLIANMWLMVIIGVAVVLSFPQCPDCELECPAQPEYDGRFDSLTQSIESQDVLLEEIFNKDYEPDFRITDMMFVEAAQKRYMRVHNWTPETHCGVLTQEFTVIMKEFGIEMQKIYAWKDNNDIGHAYNCIPFDVQVGLTDDTEWDTYDLIRTTKVYDYKED